MIDFDSIWRTQDEIRTVVNAVLGECIWNLAYDERRSSIVLELTVSLEEDAISDLCCQFLPCKRPKGPSARYQPIMTGKVQRVQSSHSTYKRKREPHMRFPED